MEGVIDMPRKKELRISHYMWWVHYSILPLVILIFVNLTVGIMPLIQNIIAFVELFILITIVDVAFHKGTGYD